MAPPPTRDSASPTAGGNESPHLADVVADAVRAVPGVADLHTGTFGEVATYLPGRRVDGIRLRADRTEVHVVLVHGVAVLATADIIRSTVQRLVGTPVDVAIQDVVDPEAADVRGEPPR